MLTILFQRCISVAVIVQFVLQRLAALSVSKSKHVHSFKFTICIRLLNIFVDDYLRMPLSSLITVNATYLAKRCFNRSHQEGGIDPTKLN